MAQGNLNNYTAKSCYGHLGGKVGDLLFERLVDLKWFRLQVGTSTVYEITEKGVEELTKLGVDLPKAGKVSKAKKS
jgi:hypothetical protein